jgi:hypothetical protein
VQGIILVHALVREAPPTHGQNMLRADFVFTRPIPFCGHDQNTFDLVRQKRLSIALLRHSGFCSADTATARGARPIALT